MAQVRGEYAGAAAGQPSMPRGPRGAVGRIGRQGQPAQPASPTPPVDRDAGELDWERLAVFGAGLALGALLGAGVTLFTAPLSGRDARRAVRRVSRRALWRGQDAWEDLRDELATATLRRKKAMRRQKRRARERVDDFRLG